MLTPASARSRATSPIAPGLSCRSTTTASRSSATEIPASSSAVRAASASSTRMWMKPLPSPTISQRPSMLTPALPVASPRSASLPGWSSMITVRSFTGLSSIAAPASYADRTGSKRGARGSLNAMPNRLASETSPYLLQHKDNPVDWRPWGPEALAEAAQEDKPILLSIGYSSCHWCHVMERESFEDEETAAYLNENFVPIKVDREERPDVDSIYMEAVQGMTGHGGWPLTVFLDSEGVPFYGGTYFPPEPRQGLPSFRQVLEATAGAYRTQREELREAAARIRESLSAVGRVEQSSQPIDEALLDRAISSLQGTFDRTNGGFGGAPKFPPASILEFLLARGATEPVTLTLDKMMHGGIYDQLGGGFARYSVDATWLVPHFEKMLYD